MASGSSAKGNPASHRMGNKHLKDYRASCWSKQQKRKDERRKEQETAAARNKQLRSAGRMTPWEYTKATGRTAKAKTNPQFQA